MKAHRLEAPMVIWGTTMLAALALSACKPAVDPAIANAQDSVRSLLRDPSSAQFQKMESFPGPEVCGEVNAKNAFGGYVGFTRFYVGPEGADLDPISAAEKCVKAITADALRIQAETRRIQAETKRLQGQAQ